METLHAVEKLTTSNAKALKQFAKGYKSVKTNGLLKHEVYTEHVTKLLGEVMLGIISKHLQSLRQSFKGPWKFQTYLWRTFKGSFKDDATSSKDLYFFFEG